MKQSSKGFAPIIGIVGILAVLLVVVLLVSKNGELQPSVPTPSPAPTTLPEENSSPTPITSPGVKGETYKVPTGWKTYTDPESKIAVYYPPDYSPKYNSNRGAGSNYAAGSYLVDKSGTKVMDFYFYRYDGGSRRESFYNGAEFDGPEAMSKYTKSASDVVLNSKTYLKIVTSFYNENEKGSEKGDRVFLLIPQGKYLYYFTYSKSLENNVVEFEKILTIVANSKFGVPLQIGGDNISCYPISYGQKNPSWDANIEADGSLRIIQRTTEELKADIDRTRIELLPNYQIYNNYTEAWREISDYEIYVDSSLKGSYKSAFVIKIPKSEVEIIREKTPSGVTSLAVYSKINGGIKTVEDKACHTGNTVSYYVQK